MDTMETKKCLKCNEAKPITSFRPNKGNPDGYCHYCKECAKAYPRTELTKLGPKMCPVCMEEKQRYFFRTTATGKILGHCKGCEAKKMGEYRDKNRERVKEIGRNAARRRREKYGNVEWLAIKSDKEALESHYKKCSIRQKGSVDQISDSYAVHRLCRQTGLKSKELREIPNIKEILEASRTLLKLKRSIRDVNTTKN